MPDRRSEITLTKAKMIWSCLKPRTLTITNQYAPIKDDVEFDTLVIRVLFRALSNAPAKSLSKRDCSGLANRIVDDLVTLSELPKMPQKTIAALQETVTQRLLIYPDCDADQPVFKYLDNNQPSFFIVADEDGNPPSQDNTSMYRSYHIAGDLPPKTYLLSDIATIFKVTSSAANLLEVTFPLDASYWYINATMHRHQPRLDDPLHKYLLVDRFDVKARYDLSKIPLTRRRNLTTLIQALPECVDSVEDI